MDHLLLLSAGYFLDFLRLVPFFYIFEYKKVNSIIFKKVNILNLLLIGFLLSMGNVLQQYALLYTDVANTAAVFTIFYVVLVPFVAYFFFKKYS